MIHGLKAYKQRDLRQISFFHKAHIKRITFTGSEGHREDAIFREMSRDKECHYSLKIDTDKRKPYYTNLGEYFLKGRKGNC